MQKKNGNSIYNIDKLGFHLDYARHYYQQGNIKKLNERLKIATKIISNIKDINVVLNAEMTSLDIFDINIIGNNIERVNNKLLACETAMKENNFFINDKQGYLNNFKNSRIRTVTADSAFEKATKEIILYLGNEKRNCLMSYEIHKFFDARQDNIREITRKFKKERIAFLEKYIQQDKQISRQINQQKEWQFEK